MILKRIATVAVATGAALALAAGPALAAVVPNFDANGDFDGTGHVGKGDVQIAFNWNNKQVNDNANGVSFRYVESTVKTQDCVDRDRGTIISRTEDVVTTTGVANSLTYDTRNNKKGDLTGFTLTGLGATTSLTSGGCAAGESPQGPAVETTTVAIQAVHNAVPRTIWTPPAAE